MPYRLLPLYTMQFFVLIALWDLTGLDLPLARLAGGIQGFAWRHDPFVVAWLHEVPRFLSMAGVVVLAVAIRWPFGVLRRLDRRGRARLLLSVIVSLAAVSLLKNTSGSSCPWDMAEFGGAAQHVSHWIWNMSDGGPGRCFPAGHASAAFAYLAGWFALRRVAPGAAQVWLVVVVVAGFVLGLAQQWRGAHYMSHTLWTAWICWSLALVIDFFDVQRAHVRKATDPGSSAPG